MKNAMVMNLYNHLLNQPITRLFGFLKTTFKNRRVDIILLSASFVCFAIFIRNSIKMEELSGIGAPIGVLKTGKIMKRSLGGKAFNLVTSGTEFFNLDAVWVGPGQKATVALESGDMLELFERTLVVLKKQFKEAGRATNVLKRQFKLAKGRVSVGDSQDYKYKDEDSAVWDSKNLKFGNTPSADDGKASSDMYPRQDSIIYTRAESEQKFTLVWPTPISGYLEIQDRQEGRRIHEELKNQRSVTLNLSQNRVYYWQIIDQQRNTLFGPNKFELRKLTESSVGKLLEGKKEGSSQGEQPVEVYW